MLADKIVNTLKEIISKGKDSPIPLHEPSFIGNEWLYVKESIDSSFVSSVGKFVDQFEKELALSTGSKYAIATVNGTSALHIALKLAGVERNDEVLIPSFTFVATANAVRYLDAIPHFMEVDEKTLGLCPTAIHEYLEAIVRFENKTPVNQLTNRRISAIVPMHTFGHPVDMDGIQKISRDFRLPIVEDAAESLGSYFNLKHTGTFGLFGVLSFNGNKIITTGGGGAILTQDETLAKKAKHITTTAKLAHKWEYTHDEVGYNYRMPNLNAALGVAQLELLPGFLEKKRKLFELYKSSFAAFQEFIIQEEPMNCKSNYWLQTLVLNKGFEKERDSILGKTNSAGIMTRPAWSLLHKLKMFQDCPKMDLSISESLEKRIINIPSSSNLVA